MKPALSHQPYDLDNFPDRPGETATLEQSFTSQPDAALPTQPLAKTAGGKRRQTYHIDLIPISDIEALEPGRFEAIKRGAGFFLKSDRGCLPTGAVKISFRIFEIDYPVEAVLCVESETRPNVEIVFATSSAGPVSASVLLPKHVTAMRLELRNYIGIVALGKFKIRELSALEFLISRACNLSRLKYAGRYLVRNGARATLQKAFTANHYQGHDPYLEWVKRNDRLTFADKRAIRSHIETLKDSPLISVIVPVYNTRPEFLRRCLESVKNQLYPNWELCIADDASDNPDIWPLLTKFAAGDGRVKLLRRPVNGSICAASNSGLGLATGSYIALLDHDDILPPHALYMVAVELSRHPDADLIYSDEDKIDAAGNRYGPNFKPDWNYDLFTSCNMICHLGVYRTALVRKLGGFREGFEGSQDYDLALRVFENSAPERIRHIPFVLYHWRVFGESRSFSTERRETAASTASLALREHLKRRGEIAEVSCGGTGETHRICRQLPAQLPMVSILVPTRDRLELLRNCLDGLLKKTDYSPLEIIVLDNESREPETLAYLREIASDSRVRVERCPGAFNFAALNNHGAALAKGSILCLLNNDIEIMEPNWLKEMVAHALRPGIGAVGAKLLYPDDTIQHAGVILGIGGVAGHAFKYFSAHDVGYCRRAKLTQNLSAVTGACMVLRKDRYLEAGGLDAENLTVAFNDIDLCLKLRAAGYENVWTPYAVLRHRESASRGAETNPNNAARFASEAETMRLRWGETLDNDPFYNPNLSLLAEDFRFAETPRVQRPWLSENH
jgi:glycosyltransferase involved in cell wall biosynthesis